MREFPSETKIGNLSTPVIDCQLEIEDLSLENFGALLDNDYLNDKEPVQAAKDRFKQRVIEGLQEAYSSGNEVYLSSIIRGMHALAKEIAPGELKLAVRASKYAMALIPNASKRVKESALRFSEEQLWQDVIDIFSEAGI